MTSREAELLIRAARLLQVEAEPLPIVLQNVLGLLEGELPPLRASVALSNGVTVVTGRSEFPAGGQVAALPLLRGHRTLGTLSFESPLDAATSLPSAEFGEALGVLMAQELEVRRLVPRPGSDALVGASGVLQDVLRVAERLAGQRGPILVAGEPGVGKEKLAEFLHRRSGVPGPFVRFHGTALPEPMVESELFGHPRGQGGRVDEAAGGTLFLDEVADLSLAVQTRILAVLHGTSPRVVASTSADLASLASTGHFLSELAGLFLRASVLVPPLRERGADIIALADHFVTRHSLRMGKTIMRISTPALEMLLTYPWPGNVRELESVLERAVLLSDDEVIHGYHLPPSLQSSVHSGTRMHGRLTDRLDSLEYEMLVEALKSTRGNVTLAARELGLTKRVMGLRLRKFELDYRPFRQGQPDLADPQDGR